MTEKTVYEQNMEQTYLIERYIEEIEKARKLLERSDYVVWKRKDLADRMFKIKISIGLIVIFSLGTGFAFCMAIGGSNCVRL